MKPKGFSAIEIVIVIALLLMVGSGVYLWQQQAHSTGNSTTSQASPTLTPTPSPTPSGEAHAISKSYPTLVSSVVSPSGGLRLSLYKQSNSLQALILSDKNGYSETLITTDPENGAIVPLSEHTWSSDSSYAYVMINSIDAFSLWLVRLDGKEFASAKATDQGHTLKLENVTSNAFFPVSPTVTWQNDTLEIQHSSLTNHWNAITGVYN